MGRMTQDIPTNIECQQNAFWWIFTYQNHFCVYLKNTLKCLEYTGNRKADQCDFIHNTNSICEKEA